MDIGKAISRVFDVWFKNVVVLAVPMLLAILIGGITIFILAGPMMAGMAFICLKLLRGEKAEIGDVFSKFDKFVPALILCLIGGVAGCALGAVSMIPVLGSLIAIAAGPLLSAGVIFGLCGIVDKNLDFGPATKEAIDRIKVKPLETWLAALIFDVLSGVGFIACGIGVLVTLPISVLGMTIIYLEGAGADVQPGVSA